MWVYTVVRLIICPSIQGKCGMVNVLKFRTVLFLFSNKMGFQGWNSQNSCQNCKQFRLDLHCLSKLFLQTTSI